MKDTKLIIDDSTHYITKKLDLLNGVNPETNVVMLHLLMPAGFMTRVSVSMISKTVFFGIKAHQRPKIPNF